MRFLPNPLFRYWTLSAVLAGGAVATLPPAGGVPWNLDRIDQAKLPLDGLCVRHGDGDGVDAYVVDTGVRKTHREFGGRADWIGDFVNGNPAGPDASDCDPPPSPGHGTHVASILGGRAFGVAPAVRLHALRILPCTGTTRTDYEAAIRAVDWITTHGRKPAVVNMSPVRWQTSDTRLDEAIRRSIRAGFVYVLSAGGMEQIGNYSPQRVEDAIKVGSTAATDAAAQPRYGPLLTLFAPGMNVQAAGDADDRATFTGDGDSYAAPLVAGIAAIYLQRHAEASPDEVKQAIVSAATPNVVVNAGDAPPRLARVIDR